MKNKLIVLLLGLMISSSSIKANETILYASDTIVDSVRISFVIFNSEPDSELIRFLLKLTPLQENVSQLYSKNKVQLMFDKLQAIRVIDTAGNENIANDYIYEEMLSSYHLIYNYMATDFYAIKEIKIVDLLLTNSKKINLL